VNTSAQTHRRHEPRPEAGWFHHLHDGDLAGRQGAVEMPLHIDPRVKEGELPATFHAGETGLNHLTGQGRDKQAMTPEDKVFAVRIEKIGGGARHG